MADDNNNENPNPEVPMDFFKFMDDTIKREAAKTAVTLNRGPEVQEQATLAREHQKRFGHRVGDRMWIGPRRY